MQTKLTLRLDEELIERAKSFSRSHGKSVSRLVADYFAVLDGPETPPENSGLPPLTASLKGALAGSEVGVADYRRYLENKYR